VNQMIWGPEIQFSDDLGGAWSSGQGQARFSGDSGRIVDRLWHIEPGGESESGGESEPGVMYAGVPPAALFRSDDSGDTWSEVKGLSTHPTFDQWQPGLGGLCLHSMVIDPRDTNRSWVGMSAVGVFGTSDGGENWQPMNQSARADFLPDPFPEFGYCPHKLLSPKSHAAFSAATRRAKAGSTSPVICLQGSGLSWAFTPRTRTLTMSCLKMRPWVTK